MQQDTKKSIERIKRQMADTHEVGATTLAELEEQRRQVERIQSEGDRAEEQLKTTERLQNKLSRWSLSFNGRAARKKANEARKHEEKQEQIKEERKERLRIEEEEESANNVEIAPHGKKKRETRRKKNKKGEEPKSKLKASNQKSLLYGSKAGNSPMDPELRQLEDDDREINEDLDDVGNQLDELMDMAKAMGNEAESHGRGLDDFTEQMSDINHKQRVANNRTGRFLTGKVRRDYEKEGMNNATGFW